jgi:hypothetical protein
MLGQMQKRLNSMEKLVNWIMKAADRITTFCLSRFPEDQVGLLQRWCQPIAKSKWFEQISLVLIVINVVGLAVEHDGQPAEMDLILSTLNTILVCAFCIELLIKV